MSTFHSTNQTLETFVTSVYLLGYVAGPLLLAPLSEIYGRSVVYHACNAGFLVWSVACALANNLPALIVMRLLAGVAGSAGMTIGAGTIGDMVPLEKRGLAMTGWIFGPVMGPTVGPLSEYLHSFCEWTRADERCSCWVYCWGEGVALDLLVRGDSSEFLSEHRNATLPADTIRSHQAGAVFLMTLLFMRESYAYTILERKTKRLRKETGNSSLRSALDTGKDQRQFFATSIVRPLKLLCLSPIVMLLSLYMAIIYGYQYLMFTTFPRVFKGQYGLSNSSIGLVYLGVGVGFLAALAFSALYSDRVLIYLTKRNGGKAKPEYRLPFLFIGAVLAPIGLFLYGWTAEYKVHWIVPIIGTAFLGASIFTITVSHPAH